MVWILSHPPQKENKYSITKPPATCRSDYEVGELKEINKNIQIFKVEHGK